MGKFKMMVVKLPFKEKPHDYQIGQIKNAFNSEDSIIETTPEELFNFLGKGYTISPYVAKNGLKSENFISCQLVVLDIDNNKPGPMIDVDTAISKLKENGFNVLGYHESYSHTKEKPKFHLFLLFNEVITNVNKITFALQTLMSCLIEQVDEQCKDLSRMFFTTNGDEKQVKLVDANATISWEDIIKCTVKNNQFNNTQNNRIPRSKEIRRLEKEFDLLSYMKEKNTTLYGDNNNSNYVMFKNCCICGHEHDLVYFKDSNRFKCFGANGGVDGTIVDYIKLTENMSEKDAINYLKYDLLHLPEKQDNIASLVNLEEIKEKHKKEIEDNLKKLGISVKVSDELEWINYSYNKNGLYLKVSSRKLADYICKEVHYFFIETTTDKNVLKYIYKNGVYKLISDNKFKGIIQSFIPYDAPDEPKCYEDAFKYLCTNVNSYVSPKELNSDRYLINFQNGLYHVDTKEFTEHTPKYKSTIQLACDYIKDAKSSEKHYFDNFINTFSNNCDENKKFLLQYLAVTISNIPGDLFKSALIIIGNGDVGKSKYISLPILLLGEENCAAIDISDLEKPFHSIKLLGKRLGYHADISGVPTKSISKFKMITGGDEITDSYKGRDLIDFKFNGNLIYGGNVMPKWGIDKGAHVYRRMIFYEPKNVIPIEQRDKDLLEHLKTELSYIVSVLLKSLDEVITNDFSYDIPTSCLELRKQVMVENDSILTFIDECIETVTREPAITDLTTGELFKMYVKWCNFNNNGYHESNNTFYRTMLDYINEVKPKKTHNGRTYYQGIAPNEESLHMYWEGIN